MEGQYTIQVARLRRSLRLLAEDAAFDLLSSHPGKSTNIRKMAEVMIMSTKLDSLPGCSEVDSSNGEGSESEDPTPPRTCQRIAVQTFLDWSR